MQPSLTQIHGWMNSHRLLFWAAVSYLLIVVAALAFGPGGGGHPLNRFPGSD
jgi:hypothetical protein